MNLKKILDIAEKDHFFKAQLVELVKLDDILAIQALINPNSPELREAHKQRALHIDKISKYAVKRNLIKNKNPLVKWLVLNSYKKIFWGIEPYSITNLKFSFNMYKFLSPFFLKYIFNLDSSPSKTSNMKIFLSYTNQNCRDAMAAKGIKSALKYFGIDCFDYADLPQSLIKKSIEKNLKSIIGQALKVPIVIEIRSSESAEYSVGVLEEQSAICGLDHIDVKIIVNLDVQKRIALHPAYDMIDNVYRIPIIFSDKRLAFIASGMGEKHIDDGALRYGSFNSKEDLASAMMKDNSYYKSINFAYQCYSLAKAIKSSFDNKLRLMRSDLSPYLYQNKDIEPFLNEEFPGRKEARRRQVDKLNLRN